MKNHLPLLLNVILLLGAATLACAENGPATITMSGKTQAAVTFNHANHQSLVSDCKSCHHMGVGNGSCNGCHGRDGRFVDAKTAVHNSCNGCHEKSGVATADNCTFCHASSSTTDSFNDSRRDRWRRR